MKQSLWAILQSLPDLRKGCVPCNFTQVEFLSQNFPKFNAMQFNSIFYFVCRKNYKTELPDVQ
jgi:hypothetical protein